MKPEAELTSLTAAQAAERIADGRLRSVDLVQALLARIDQTAGLNAFIHLDRDALLAAAAEADAADANARSGRPLHGVPLALKDNIDVAGIASTAGSRAMAERVPQKDSPLAARLRAAGALVLGKANMHEFAYGITTNNTPFGAARNPYDPSRMPGGSSGGTAVAVASRGAPAGIGTDTGGSVRIPAALCGLVGFRPSTGRWPTAGVVPISSTLDTPGPMARDVADCVLLDQVVTGSAAPAPAALRGLRIGVPRAYYWSPLDAGLAEVAEATLARLAAAGVELVPCEVRQVAELTAAGMFPVAMYETLPTLQAHHEAHGWPFDAKALAGAIDSPDVRAVYESLQGEGAIPQAAYRQALDTVRPRLRAAFADCFAQNRIDAILFPTTPRPAAPIGEDLTVELAGEQVPTFPTFVRNTGPGAFAGLPGISLPVGRTTDGLPVGLELDGPIGSDLRLLAVALAIESVLPAMPPPP